MYSVLVAYVHTSVNYHHFQIFRNTKEMSKTEFVECSQTIKQETDEVETKISLENDPLHFISKEEEHGKKVCKYYSSD